MLALWITGIGCDVTVSTTGALLDAPGPGLLTFKAPSCGFCRSMALSATFNCVGLTYVVGRAFPYHKTAEFASNPVPVMVMVAALPGGTIRGEIPVITAVGLFTANAAAGELPPPGAGFCAESWLCELAIRLAAGRIALTSVALTKVVASAAPFHSITVDETNPDPLMSSGVSADPANTLVGLTLPMAGTGLFTVKSTDADVPPPGAGFTTVNFPTVPFARSLTVSVALRLDADPNVVATGVPFHCAAELAMNPEPLIETDMLAEPAIADGGVSAVIDGEGFNVGPGVPGLDDPPPQPPRIWVPHRTKARDAHVARVMDGLRVRMHRI